MRARDAFEHFGQARIAQRRQIDRLIGFGGCRRERGARQMIRKEVYLDAEFSAFEG